MTPASLMALVLDNHRRYDQILNNITLTFSRAAARLLLVEQDICVGLRYLPSLQLGYDLNLENSVRRALDQRRQRESEWLQQLNDACRDYDHLERELRTLQREKEAVTHQALLEILGDPESAQLGEERKAAFEERLRLTDDHTDLVKECAEKLPAFQSCELHRFLTAMGHGTPHYSRWRIFHGLDNWLARRIGYRENRRNELLLTEMPAHLASLIDKQNQRIALNEKQWSSRLAATPSAIVLARLDEQRPVLIQRLLEVRKQMVDTGDELRLICMCEDQESKNAFAGLAPQLDRTLEDFLPEYRTGIPAEDQQMEQFLNIYNEAANEFDELDNLDTTALNDFERAHKLLMGFLSLLREEQLCSAGCPCDCHQSGDYQEPCECTFEDARGYEYAETLDAQQLVNRYMRQAVTLEAVIERFRCERRYLVSLPQTLSYVSLEGASS